MRILRLILALIGVGNVSVAIFLTILRIEKADNTPKKIATALYFVFTILGIYAAYQIIT